MSILSRVLLIILLIIINGFFAGSEAALVASNEIKVKVDAEKNKKAALTLKYIKNSTNFLSTIQIGITFIGFINGFLAAESFTAPILKLMGQSYQESNVWNAIIKILITLILTYLQVVFGELLPKKIAIQNPEKFIYRSVGFLNALNHTMKPLVWLFTKSADGIGRLIGIKDEKEELTEDEIRMLVVGSGDAIKELEKEMIENVLDFDDRTVDKVMTHRTEMIAIDINTNYQDMIKVVRAEQFSRIPVFRDSIDNIVGILHIKDLLNYDPGQTPPLRKIIRKPFFVPESMKTNELFGEMQKNNTHMAIVIDEFGGTSGLVTIEDLLEEIVGDIFDEYDDVINEVEIIDENTYIVDALADISDIEDIIEIDLPIDDYDTLSGFILDLLGRFPEENEHIEVEYNHYKFEVLEYNDKVIEKIKISKLINEESEENDE